MCCNHWHRMNIPLDNCTIESVADNCIVSFVKYVTYSSSLLLVCLNPFVVNGTDRHKIPGIVQIFSPSHHVMNFNPPGCSAHHSVWHVVVTILKFKLAERVLLKPGWLNYVVEPIQFLTVGLASFL